MNTILTTGKKKVHSDWTLMQSYFNDDGTFFLNFADKNSNDQIRLNLEKEDIGRISKVLAKFEAKNREQDREQDNGYNQDRFGYLNS